MTELTEVNESLVEADVWQCVEYWSVKYGRINGPWVFISRDQHSRGEMLWYSKEQVAPHILQSIFGKNVIKFLKRLERSLYDYKILSAKYLQVN
jgi:hypothetical protein